MLSRILHILLTSQNTRYTQIFHFSVNYALHGLNVVGYHIFNLAIAYLQCSFSVLVYYFELQDPSPERISPPRFCKTHSSLYCLFACHARPLLYIVQRLSMAAQRDIYSASFSMSMQGSLCRIPNRNRNHCCGMEHHCFFLPLFLL